MEQRHDPATTHTPGLTVPSYTAVAPYPVAAILTAWVNYFRGAPGTVQRPAGTWPAAVPINPEEPLLPAGAAMAFWPEARVPIAAALAAVPRSWYPARCVLPVPGDLGGLPAGTSRAIAAGQALVFSQADTAVVISPITLGGSRMWTAERAASPPVAPVNVTDMRREIMSALEKAVVVAESAVLPRTTLTADLAAVAEAEVPLPPGTDASVVSLARQSATVLSIVDAVMAHLPTGAEAAPVAQALVPLGRAARGGLSVAFTMAAGH